MFAALAPHADDYLKQACSAECREVSCSLYPFVGGIAYQVLL